MLFLSEAAAVHQLAEGEQMEFLGEEITKLTLCIMSRQCMNLFKVVLELHSTIKFITDKFTSTAGLLESYH